MPDKRPEELDVYLETTAEKNDTLIVDALSKLEDPEKRGKLKATVASVCQLTGLTRNTVRSRQWALDRLRALKLKLRNAQHESPVHGEECPNDADLPGRLRKRIKQVLLQNTVLYEEILSLKAIIEQKDKTIEVLKARKIASVTTLPRRVDISKMDSN